MNQFIIGTRLFLISSIPISDLENQIIICNSEKLKKMFNNYLNEKSQCYKINKMKL